MKLWRLWKAHKEYTKAIEKRPYHNEQLILFRHSMSTERFDQHLDEIESCNYIMEKAKNELLS
ncbi:hypothetical protein CN416_04200 [Bacillus thuringiensis]|nr:hypothetical protein CN416_04200 [Bacillus thuringiensis]